MARKHSNRDMLLLVAVGVGAYLLLRNSGAGAGYSTATGLPVDFNQYPAGAGDPQGFPGNLLSYLTQQGGSPAFTPAAWTGAGTGIV